MRRYPENPGLPHFNFGSKIASKVLIKCGLVGRVSESSEDKVSI